MIGIFRWCNFLHILPAVYDDSMSYYETLCAIGTKLNEVISSFNTMDTSFDSFVNQLNELVEDYNNFTENEQDRVNTFIDSWLENNYQQLIGYVGVHSIYFGLDDTGHLVAHVPENWSEIIFDTGYDYSDQETYGRLILRYDADSPTTLEG